MLADPAVVARMAYFQRQDRRPSLDELKAHVAVEIAKWGPVVKDKNVQME